jgi:hypothetical protein
MKRWNPWIANSFQVSRQFLGIHDILTLVLIFGSSGKIMADRGEGERKMRG